MRVEITKEHVGSKIYAIPTGNNASRGKQRQEIKEFDVVGFGRVYAKVVMWKGGCEVSIHPKTGATQDAIKSGYGGNAGYIFFNTKEDAEEYQEQLELRSKAYTLLSSFDSTTKLDIETIKTIISELESNHSK